MNGCLHILLVEDDANLGYLLRENLENKDFRITVAQTGATGIEAVSNTKFDLCILDVMLPGIDGFSIAKHLRQKHSDTPFIFLSARSLEQDKLQGFELGADDYITKPFGFKELYYRIMVILRRSNIAPPEQNDKVISLGDVKLNVSERTVTINGHGRKLSQREAAILKILLQQSGMYVTRSVILKEVWGNDDYFTAKSMDVYMTRIRKLLKDAPAIEIENLYGTGYRIRQA